MRKSTTTNPARALSGVFLIVFIFLTTSCIGAATPTTEQPPSNSSPEQVAELPASVPNISPGQHLRFETISLEQGLSQSTVFCMLQDSQGFMWFGTEDGLNKYDGYNFTIYKHDPENPNSGSYTYIQAMIEDRSGMIWFGTSEGGLVRFNRNLDQFTHYRNDPNDPSSLSDNEITALFQSQDGSLWIGTGDGLERFAPENDRFIHYQHNPDDPNSLSSNAVSAIYEDQGGTLWIGTDDAGLNQFDRENDLWQHYVNDSSNPQSLSHNKISALFEDKSGTLWIGTDGGGLNRLDGDQFIHYQHAPDDPSSLNSGRIEAIYQDREGILWIGIYDGGLNRFVPEDESFIHYQIIPGDPHSLSSNVILSIYQDREGVLWFGTIGGGVNKLNLGRWNFPHYKNNPENPNSLGDNMVRTINQDSAGNLWVGTMFGGVNEFDRQAGTWHHYRHNPDDPESLSKDWASDIYFDRSGVLWIATSNGLDRFDPETNTFAHYHADPENPDGTPSNYVAAIMEDQEGEFWIGTAGGLYRFDRQAESWGQPYRHNPDDPKSLSDDVTFRFLEDRQGRFWIGTFNGGLNQYHPETETFTRYQNNSSDPYSLSNDLVATIFQDQDNILWVGNPGGLDKFNPATGTFIHYRENDGLPNDTIYCITEDKQGQLWISTNKGLSRFDPHSEVFKNYDVTDGLQSNEFNGGACYVSENGELFFGGIDGFNAFFPENIRENPAIPPIVLTSLIYGGRRVNLEQVNTGQTDIILRWPENGFEFEYAALSYAQPEKNQYAYYLEGFEETWNEVGTRRYGQYTNLPGGTYTLRVKGSNNDGIWNEVGTELKITVVPPFWATWWFQGIALMVLLGVIYGGYRLRVRNLEMRGRELESLMKQRTAELIETQEALRQSELEKAITEERSRLARELHDSVTQSLHSSSLMAEAGQRLAGAGDIERARGYLVRLGEISQQALREMRLLVFELRPLALKEFGLVGALQQRLDAVERRSGVETQLSTEEGLELPERIEKELFRVAIEALNNALKHANPTRIMISLQKDIKRDIPCIELAIVDNGIGFDPESKDDEGGLGLLSMQQRIENLGGELVILSTSGEGTQVKACVDLEV